MEALVSSTLAVTLAEIGDKTQLLALVLAARYAKPFAIALGIFIATLLNHSLSAWVGAFISTTLPKEYFGYVIGASFLLVAIWMLIPDKADEDSNRFGDYGVLLATTLLFFLAEMGDKTQIATVLLSAKYSTDFINMCLVIFGTTLGMLIANVPVVYFGSKLMEKLPMALTRKIAFAIFMSLAVITLGATFMGAN
ncbi:MAG: TMEM165/GDT1 family protein [Cellvibrio sp.]